MGAFVAARRAATTLQSIVARVGQEVLTKARQPRQEKLFASGPNRAAAVVSRWQHFSLGLGCLAWTIDALLLLLLVCEHHGLVNNHQNLPVG